MEMGGPATDALAVRLISQSSRFARAASRGVAGAHSLVAMRVLANLHQDGGLRIGELAAREGITQPAMTATANRLEAEGLVVREADPDDARAAIVRITDAGVVEREAFRRRAAERVTPLLGELDPRDLSTLERAAELLEALTASIAHP